MMKNQIKKYFGFIKDLSVHFSRDFSSYFYKGWKAGLMGPYAHAFARSLIFYLNQFRIYLYIRGIEQHHIKEEKIKRLQNSSLSLHSLLPQDERLSYSILIPVKEPRFELFKQSLESALSQSAPHAEILIGLMEPPFKELEELIERVVKDNGSKVRVIDCFWAKSKELVVGHLAEIASGNFLLILGQEDWLRPDFLFRYEQTLRIFPNPEKRVVYCNVNSMSDKGYFIPNSEYRQPDQLSFPFFFKPFVEKGLLIPKALWIQSGGLNESDRGADFEGLLLRLDLVGALFQHIPLCLYSVRASNKGQVVKSQEAFLNVLQSYDGAKGLNWKWSPGLLQGSIRAVPPLQAHSIQVVIPYKDQKELTIKCVHSVLKQTDVSFKIVAVDNRSHDRSIAGEIEGLGAEVICIDEPFNYSRLNNLAVKKGQTAADCDVILFLNNDVELEPGALSEMVRWIDQPLVGMVGCRLHYPDGRLQHGGVAINPHGREEMRWEHIEKLRPFDEMSVTKELGFFDAVTAACCMMKRQTFLEAGGFDEVWYPIGYSDTHLAVKVASLGLKCFYTPYAVGVHHESVSRKSAIEDYENSWWLHHLLMKNEKFKGRTLE